MKYKLSFIFVVAISSILGILIGLFTNNIISENELNTNEKINKNKIRNSDKEKNKIFDDNDYLHEDDDENKEENKKNDNNKIEEENEKENIEHKKQKEINIDNEHTVHLSLSIDAKYLYPSIVFLTSLLENRLPSTIYNIYILTGDSINMQHKTKINSLINKYGKDFIKITYFNMKNEFREAMTNNYISTASYYRIALPSLLPNVDRIIYSDTDVINFADLTEMYNLELKDNIYFRGILDDKGLISELRFFGIYENKYMNAGILLMNLKAIRKDNIENRIRDFIRNNFLDHHDQTAINAVCHNNIELLSIKYAVFNFEKYEDIDNFYKSHDKKYRYSETELKQAIYEPTLLHYVGWTKPWDHGYTQSKAEYWWYYAKKTDFYDEILNNYKFSKDEIETLLTKIPKDGGLLKRNYKK